MFLRSIFLHQVFKRVFYLVVVIAQIGCTNIPNEITIYISEDGLDSNNGTQTSPFQTFGKVSREIEKFTSSVDSATITVYIREGRYELKEPIVLSSENISSKHYNIRFIAFNNEAVEITGAKEIKDWEKLNNSSNIWVAEFKSRISPRELYINGNLGTLARTKEIIANAWDATDDPLIKKTNLIKSYTTYQGNLPVYGGYELEGKYREMLNWKNSSDIEAVYLQGWAYVVCPVDSILENGDSIYMKMHMPSFKDAQIKGGVHVEDPSYFQNALELLDEPGEWYYDKSIGKIYYSPKEGEIMGNAEVIIPSVERLVELNGTIDNNLKNITFEGIDFSYSTYLKPSIDGFVEVQATLTKDPDEDSNMHGFYHKMGAAIELNATDNVKFKNCSFTKLAASGINVNRGSKNTVIESSHLYSIGGNAIQIGGFNITDAHPKDKSHIVYNTKIHNNLIHDIGTIYKGSIGVLNGYTKKTEVTNNEIYNIAYSGISLGWGWGFWDKGGKIPENPKAHPNNYPVFDKHTISSDHLVGWNHIYNVMQRLTDGAGIYTLSMMENSRIIGNYIHDNPKGLMYEQSEYMIAKYTQGWPGGIYLDEGSGGIEVSENLVHDVIQPYFYNNLKYDGYPWHERENTNRVHGNYFSSMPFNSDELRYLGRENDLEVELDNLPIKAKNIMNNAGRLD